MDESGMLERLRAGDELAFRAFVQDLGGPLARLARSFTRDRFVVDEAVEATWLEVIHGLHEVPRGASLRAWAFEVLVHHARRLAVREHQHRSSTIAIVDDWDDERLAAREPGMSASGRWLVPPAPWALDDPGTDLLGREFLERVQDTVEDLPNAQRAVVILRELEGFGAAETCRILGIEAAHERVLLHRGRSRVRQLLDRCLHAAVPRDATRMPRVDARP